MRGYCAIGLDNPQYNPNIGAVLRAAGCFGASMVAFTGSKYKKARTDVHRAHKRLPLIHVEDLKDIIPYACVPVAIEIMDGATSLIDYQHPHRAFYIFGPENSTLGSRVLSWCRDVVSIPSDGALNLAACVNIVLYDRLLKGSERGPG